MSEQVGHSYCGPAGGYEDLAECRKIRTDRQRTCTYSMSSKKASHVRASVLWAPGDTCAEFTKHINNTYGHEGRLKTMDIRSV